MNLSDLDYKYPEELVALEPAKPLRALCSQSEVLSELDANGVLDQFEKGDILVINDTQVQKCRVFAEGNLEVLFVKPLGDRRWHVLFPAKKYSLGQEVKLPAGFSFKLLEKNIPQTIEVSSELTDEYFSKYGELALPPYIQKARDQRHMIKDDEQWYQTDWCKHMGSCAAPTASLHFSGKDLKYLIDKGVKVVPLTLHVGLGTFLPIRCENLDEHIMHKEYISISKDSVIQLQSALDSKNKIWALGTTVTRSLESWKLGLLDQMQDGSFVGESDLFIQPGFKFQVVDCLMTNFHQPKSTLLALVSAFTSVDHVKKAYQFAMERKFKLFSYGDLSLWMK